MLYLNVIFGKKSDVHLDLTLTNVVFECVKMVKAEPCKAYLTLTNVVFE